MCANSIIFLGGTFCIHMFLSFLNKRFAQSAGAVEYTDCFSAEE